MIVLAEYHQLKITNFSTRNLLPSKSTDEFICKNLVFVQCADVETWLGTHCELPHYTRISESMVKTVNSSTHGLCTNTCLCQLIFRFCWYQYCRIPHLWSSWQTYMVPNGWNTCIQIFTNHSHFQRLPQSKLASEVSGLLAYLYTAPEQLVLWAVSSRVAICSSKDHLLWSNSSLLGSPLNPPKLARSYTLFTRHYHTHLPFMWITLKWLL